VSSYRGQIQDRANLGVPHAAKTSITYRTINRQFNDGETYQPRKPIYTSTNEQFGSL